MDAADEVLELTEACRTERLQRTSATDAGAAVEDDLVG